MAARRRLSKNEGVRAAIERGWWPYLPLRWVVLNDKEVLKVNCSDVAKQKGVRIVTGAGCEFLSLVLRSLRVKWTRLLLCRETDTGT